MPSHIVQGAPPTDGLSAGVPPEKMPLTHPTSKDMVMGAPAPIKSVSADGFTEGQPSHKENVKSGQGPV